MRWIAMSLVLAMPACINPGFSDTTGGSFSGGVTGGVDTSSSMICLEGDGVTAEFWFTGSPTVDTETCTVTAVRLATDDLDIELDLDCEGPVEDGTGPSQQARTIKLGPSATRPEVTLGDVLEVSANSQMQACDADERVALWRDDGVLLAAGFTPYEAAVSVSVDEDLELSLELEMNDSGCLEMNARLGNNSTFMLAHNSTTLTEGGHTYRIDIGSLRGPEPAGDDCGGNATRFDAVVVREP